MVHAAEEETERRLRKNGAKATGLKNHAAQTWQRVRAFALCCNDKIAFVHLAFML